MHSSRQVGFEQGLQGEAGQGRKVVPGGVIFVYWGGVVSHVRGFVTASLLIRDSCTGIVDGNRPFLRCFFSLRICSALKCTVLSRSEVAAVCCTERQGAAAAESTRSSSHTLFYETACLVELVVSCNCLLVTPGSCLLDD